MGNGPPAQVLASTPGHDPNFPLAGDLQVPRRLNQLSVNIAERSLHLDIGLDGHAGSEQVLGILALIEYDLDR